MNNLLNAGQVELGNVILAKNYKGEDVVRRLVGGTYGSVTKFFLIDADTLELKSRKRDTKEEVLDGFDIYAISAVNTEVEGTVKKDYELGDTFYANVDGSLVARKVVGGHAYGEDIFFAIDDATGKRCSRTKTTVEEVLEGYEIELIIG